MTFILLDVSRLFMRAHHAAPTGIDRVEYAYAEWLLARDPQQAGFAITLPGRLWCRVPRPVVRRLVDVLARRWRRGARGLPLFALMFCLLAAACVFAGVGRVLLPVRRPAFPVAYVNVSHHLLSPRTLAALLTYYDARFVAMVHDLIPILYPEYARPGHADLHRRRLSTVLALASGILTNSEATLQAVKNIAPEARPRLRSVPLGAQLPSRRPAESTGARYFICVGTIEPRKNHLLLLHLWREWAERASIDRPPPLLLIGRRGWENEMVVDLLERCEAIRPFVQERRAVSDDELAVLMGGAIALLMPSFAEGYGLPVVEALAAGVPVLCSDLPAHREIAGSVAEYIDPLDGVAWRAAIEDYAAVDSVRRAAQLDRLVGWRAPSWSDHFATAERFIEEVAAAEARP